MYRIAYGNGVADDLGSVPKSHRAGILDRIELQLKYEPTRQTRNRKILVGLVPPWDHVDPIWELRIGGYRVFYDVDEVESTVIIRAIRHKPPLQENRGDSMRQIGVERADLEACISQAQQERLVITRKGRPVALLVGIEGMDPEQVELGSSDRFWKLIVKRRRQKTMSRAELEQRVKGGK